MGSHDYREKNRIAKLLRNLIKRIFFGSKQRVLKIYNFLLFQSKISILRLGVHPLYVITSKDEHAGTQEDDVANPLLVTEIATELIITRLHLLDLLNSGRITRNAIVVCAEERKCLYTKIFNKVISYHELKSLGIPKRRILDLLDPYYFNKLASGPVGRRLIPYLPFYQNWNRDKELILSVDTKSFAYKTFDKPFIALVIRMRGAWPEKNMFEVFWHDLIKILLETELDILVFGRGSEVFCTDSRVVHVSSFMEWCHVVRSPNIRQIGSTMTGAVYPALVFGRPGTKLTLIDNLNLMYLHEGDPSFYHESINFSKCSIEFINHSPTPKEYFYALTKDL